MDKNVSFLKKISARINSKEFKEYQEIMDIIQKSKNENNPNELIIIKIERYS